MWLRFVRVSATGISFLLTLGATYAAARAWLAPFLTWSSARVHFDIGQDLIAKLGDAGAIGLALATGLFVSRATWRLSGKALASLRPASDFSHDLMRQAMTELGEEVALRLDRETARWDLWRAPLVVTMRSTERAVQASPANVIPGDSTTDRLRLRADSNEIASLLQALPYGQMVILGMPGAGKTIMAMRLAIDFATERPDAASSSVPVYLPLAAWNPAVPLDDWLSGRLTQDFPYLTRKYGRRLMQRLMRTGRVLAVLDGLDEVVGAAPEEIIKKVDRVFTARMRFVVTCRTNEYDEAVQKSQQYLSRAAVLEIDPVEAATAAAYLSRTVGDTKRWRPLLDDLSEKQDSALAKALDTPLMLFLVRMTYEDPATDPGELLDPSRFQTAPDIERYLLDAYISAAYDPHHRPRFPLHKARRWLGTLAHGGREISWWNLASRTPALWMAFVLAMCSGWLCYLILGPTLTVLWVGLSCWCYVKLREALSDFYAEVLTDDLRAGVRSHLRRYRMLATLFAVTVAMAVGSLVGLWLTSGVGVPPDAAQRFALGVGLLFGFTAFLDSVWGSYLLSRLYLALRGWLPLQLMRFLEDAHTRGVLRRPAGAYQFRHARLQDRLQSAAPNLLPSNGWHAVNAPASRSQVFARLLRASMLSLAVHSTVVVLPLLAAAMITGSTAGYKAGARPTVVDRSLCSPHGCISRVDWRWKVPSDSSVTTVLNPDVGVRILFTRSAYLGLGGDVEVAGCAGARVAMSVLTGDTKVLKTFTLDADGGSRLGDLGDWPGTRLDAMTVTFKRLDAAPCTADVVWTNPSLRIDKGLPIREFLT